MNHSLPAYKPPTYVAKTSKCVRHCLEKVEQAKAETFLTQTHVRFLKMQGAMRGETHFRSTHLCSLTRVGGPAGKLPSCLVLLGVPGPARIWPCSTNTHTHTHAVITAWLQTIPLKTTRKEWESSSLHWKQGDGAQEQAWSLWLGLSPLAPSRIQFAFWKQKLWAAACDTSSAGSFNWSSQHLIS